MCDKVDSESNLAGKIAVTPSGWRPVQIQFRTSIAANAAVYRTLLGDLPGLSIVRGPLLDGCIADAVIAPTNSFGYLDAGIDSAFVRRFGPRLQRALQERIACEFDAELPVGEAIIIPTGDFAMPFMIAAPTTQFPGYISGEPLLYNALHAALRAVDAWNIADEWPPIETIVLPDLASATHKWRAEILVLQVREALEARNRARTLPDQQSRAA